MPMTHGNPLMMSLSPIFVIFLDLGKKPPPEPQKKKKKQLLILHYCCNTPQDLCITLICIFECILICQSQLMVFLQHILTLLSFSSELELPHNFSPVPAPEQDPIILHPCGSPYFLSQPHFLCTSGPETFP